MPPSSNISRMSGINQRRGLLDIANRVNIDLFNEHCRVHGVNTYKFKKLPKEELTALIVRAQSGNKQAREEVIRQNFLLVVKVVQSFRMYGCREVEQDDLLQCGLMGLNHAIDAFDASLEFAFSTYAVHWIDQYIRRETANTARAIRIPVHVWKDGNDLYKAFKSLGAENRESRNPPTKEEVLRRARLTDERGERAYDAFIGWHMMSIDAPLNTDSEGGDSNKELFLEHALTIDETEESIEYLNHLRIKDLVKMGLSILNVRERFVVVKRLGLGDGDEFTLDEIATLLGVTRERIRQIQEKAMKKMVATLKLLGIDPSIFGGEVDPEIGVVKLQGMSLKDALSHAKSKFCHDYKKKPSFDVPEEVLAALTDEERSYMFCDIDKVA